jgi:hypothetical protein
MEHSGNAPAPAPDNKRWLLGCGIGCLAVILLLIAGAVGGYFWVRGKIAAVTAELEAEGFRRHAVGQVVEVTEDLDDKAILVGQMVKVAADSHADLAIIAQSAEIHGVVAGDLAFWGQMLTIMPTAEIRGNVNAMAQAVVNQGVVAGQITGVYQTLQNPGDPP